jgi:hypothetical protein
MQLSEMSENQMKYSDSEIALAARQRIAKVFGMLADRIRPEHVFGEDLRSSGKSDFKYNEYDQMLHDIRDCADRQSLKQIDSGALEVRTVAEYCDHMVRCYQTNEKAVLSALGLPPRRNEDA